jgi:hypothetical protein
MPVLHRDLLECLHQLVLPADQVVRQQVLWGQEHENLFQGCQSGFGIRIQERKKIPTKVGKN